jgi:hypothetical protein
VQRPPDFEQNKEKVLKHPAGNALDFNGTFFVAECPGQVIKRYAAVSGVCPEPKSAEQVAQTARLRKGKAAEKVKKPFDDTKRYIVTFVHTEFVAEIIKACFVFKSLRLNLK